MWCDVRFRFQWENKLNDEQKCLKMLVKNTEDDCEKQISEKKRQYVAEVDNLKELYLKTTKEVKEFKTKHKLYVIFIVLIIMISV